MDAGGKRKGKTPHRRHYPGSYLILFFYSLYFCMLAFYSPGGWGMEEIWEGGACVKGEKERNGFSVEWAPS